MIACWEAKYHYYFWRPNHAIQRADTDGNPATSPEPTWLPLLTGNHRSTRPATRCFTGGRDRVAAAATSGRSTSSSTFTSTVAGTGPPRTYGNLDELVADVENARVWGGLHYRTTMTQTAKHFPQIARDVGKQYFLEGHKHHGHDALKVADDE